MIKKICYFISIFYFFGSCALSSDYSDREKKLFKEVRCIICNSQSIFDSNSDLAASMREIISNKISENKSDDEIKKYLTLRYGKDVLFSPPLDKYTYFLWFAPSIILICGIIIFKKYIFTKLS